jgi:hypothetical protein
MATLVLTAVAAALTDGMSLWIQAAAQAAAAVAGSYIDTSLFAPKIHNTGPRLSDLTLQVSSYGQPRPRVYGAENRIAGNVIWSTGLRETATTEKQGGKGLGGGGTAKTTTYSYDVSCAIALCQGPIKGVGRIWADGKLFRDADGQQKQAGELRVYLGDETQLPDPAMQAALGVDATPAFRGTAYVVFETLQLADFGNRLPVFTFEVECELATVETIAADLCRASGLADDEFDAGGVEASDVRGFVIGSPSSARGALEPLRQAFFFDVTEREGRLTFFRSDRSADIKVPKAHLAAHDHGAERPRDYDFSRISDLEQPREIVVQHTDPDRDYQPNAQRARRSTGRSESDITLELPITLDAKTGKAIAEHMMGQARRRKDGATFTLPTRYLFTEPGDKVVVPFDDGRERTIRVEAKTDFLPGRVELRGVQDGSAVLSKVSAVAATPTVPPQAVNLPGSAYLELLDIPLLRDEDDGPGFYAAVAGVSSGFIGAALFRSTDGGISFDPFFEFVPPGVIGTALDALANDVDPETWDETSSLTVNLINDIDLESVTEAQVLDGANAALVGDEIVQFRTATLIAARTWRLSGFLRGRKGTDDKIPLATRGQRFVFLATGRLARIPGLLTDVGVARQYKAAPIGSTVSDAVAVTFTDTGRSIQPLAPTQLRVSGAVGGDLDLAWTRRTRFAAPWRDLIDAPLGEASEGYELRIVDGGGALKRTVTTATPSATYTAAQQTADFGAPLAAAPHWRVAQTSAIVGPGLFASSDFTRGTPPIPWLRERNTITTAGTAPATSTSTVPTIAAGAYVSPTDAGLRYFGSNITVSGDASGGAATAGAPRQSAANGPMPLVIEFTYDGAALEVHHASLNIQLWVDDEIAFAAGRGFQTTSFATEWRRFDFPDARVRKLRLVMQVSYFSGLRIEPGRIVRPTRDRANSRMIVMGDSYTVGAQADPWASGYAHQLAQLFDCDLWPSAVGGTGYLSPFTIGGPGNYIFRDRLATDVYPWIRAGHADVFVVLGGLNDRAAIDPAYTNAAFDAEVATFYAAVAANLPADARVVICSIQSHPTTNAEADTLHRNGTLKTIAAANAWPFIDMIEGRTYARDGTPFAAATGPWFPDYSLIDPDLVHPTNAGHDYLAQTKLAPELETALQDYN